MAFGLTVVLVLGASHATLAREAEVVHYWVVRVDGERIGIAQFDSDTVFFLGSATLVVPIPLYLLICIGGAAVAGLYFFWHRIGRGRRELSLNG